MLSQEGESRVNDSVPNRSDESSPPSTLASAPAANDPIEPSPQSFVIRIWHESPYHWRGTILHVQTKGQQAFTKMEQAFTFIQQRSFGERKVSSQPQAQSAENDLLARVAKASQSALRPAPTTSVHSWLPRRRLAPAFALATLVVLIGLTLLMLNPQANVPLTGTAVGTGIGLDMLLAFIAGMFAGGMVVGFWLSERT